MLGCRWGQGQERIVGPAARIRSFAVGTSGARWRFNKRTGPALDRVECLEGN